MTQEKGTPHIQPASRENLPAILRLRSNARWKHVHLDWFSAQEAVEASPTYTASHKRKLIACLSAPQEPARVSWLRLFLIRGPHEPQQLWDLLWPPVRDTALQSGIDIVAALATTRWLPPLLYQNGFSYVTDVVFLERSLKPLPPMPELNVNIRPMLYEDLPQLTRLDHRAFAPIWRHSLDALQRAFRQAAHATVLESDDALLGYQISTASLLGAHLARVAVDPDWHGRGLGTAIIADAMRTLHQQGFSSLSVNTQVDNLPSQRLYQRLGFHRTGTRYPVLMQRLRREMAKA